MTTSEKLRPLSVLQVAAWLGVVSGLVEGAFLWLCQQMRWTGYYDLVFAAVGKEQVWISALVNLTGFTVVGVFAAIGVRWLPAKLGTVAVLGGFAFLTFWDWLSVPARLSTNATTILALGLTVQFTRMVVPRLDALRGLVHRTLPVLVALPFLIAGAQVGWNRASEAYTVSRSPEPAAGAPNVLLIVLDMTRADHVSAYGYPRETTPYIDQLAREGVLFENAYATSSWTLPSHTSLLTGTYPYEHGAGERSEFPSVDRKLLTLGEALQQRGYTTAGFTANNIFLGHWLGFDRGFGRYENLYESAGDALLRTLYGRRLRMFKKRRRFDPPSPLPTPRAPLVHGSFLSWLDRQPQRPFFAFINLMETHSPFEFPSSFSKTFEGEAPYENRVSEHWKFPEKSIPMLRRFTNSYDRSIALVDEEVRTLLAELAKRGKLENTLVVITSDHGELLGEHGLDDHSNALYEPVIRVPLVMRLPGRVPAGVRVGTPVTHRDFPATVMDLANSGTANPFKAGLPWRKLWEGPGDAAHPAPVILTEVDAANFPDTPENWPVRKGWLKSIIRDGWKLILHQHGEMELFHLAQDPLETKDLVETVEGKQVAADLKAALERLMVKYP